MHSPFNIITSALYSIAVAPRAMSIPSRAIGIRRFMYILYRMIQKPDENAKTGRIFEDMEQYGFTVIAMKLYYASIISTYDESFINEVATST